MTEGEQLRADLVRGPVKKPKVVVDPGFLYYSMEIRNVFFNDIPKIKRICLLKLPIRNLNSQSKHCKDEALHTRNKKYRFVSLDDDFKDSDIA